MDNTTILYLTLAFVAFVISMGALFWAAYYCGTRRRRDDTDHLGQPTECYSGYFEQLRALKAKDSREIVLYTQRSQWYDINAVLLMGLEIGRELTEMGISVPEVSLWDDGRRFRWVFEDEKSAFLFKMKFSNDIVGAPFEGFVA